LTLDLGPPSSLDPPPELIPRPLFPEEVDLDPSCMAAAVATADAAAASSSDPRGEGSDSFEGTFCSFQHYHFLLPRQQYASSRSCSLSHHPRHGLNNQATPVNIEPVEETNLREKHGIIFLNEYKKCKN